MRSWRITTRIMASLSARRAWIEISAQSNIMKLIPGSLSARRAWIEMVRLLLISSELIVALRKESVDRNGDRTHGAALPRVALRKESVDRNIAVFGLRGAGIGRSPQGERG